MRLLGWSLALLISLALWALIIAALGAVLSWLYLGFLAAPSFWWGMAFFFALLAAVSVVARPGRAQ